VSETCPLCQEGSNLLAVEYGYPHPCQYDGVSEWRCLVCGCRWGRWTGRILGAVEHEPPYGEEHRHGCDQRKETE
jgi:hypothetical protein